MKDMRDEQGATMVFVAATLFLLIGVAALAIDLSGVRLDRAIDQRVADSAASAGAIDLFEVDGAAGCTTAINYVEANAGVSGLDSTNCATIPSTCNPASPSVITTSDGRLDVTIVHPVPDDHGLMTSGVLGAGSQSVVTDDGAPCDRIAVQISSVRESTFSRVLGASEGRTTVHAVAIAGEGANASAPLNLLLLDRTGCHVMHASGNGGIVVGAVPDPENPGSYLSGVGAADSDGSECLAGEGVIYKQGSNAEIRADGPPGVCTTDDPATPDVGEGCGLLHTFAPADPSVCLSPACQSDGPPAVDPKPLPTTMSERLTRAPIDHAYNCVSDYDPSPTSLDDAYGLTIGWATSPLTAAAGQDIAGCSGGSATIYQTIDAVGPSDAPDGTYTPWSPANPCTVTTPIPVVSGNVWVNCPVFEVKDTVTIQGNVVFDGDVLVTGGSGALTIDNTDSEGLAFMRDGNLHKDGDADLAFIDTTVYVSKDSWITMAGGDGSLTWSAPNTGSRENLALWSDGTTMHEWAGQANLAMRGVFFVPWARVEYAGTGGQNQASAQFIAHSLHARGQGFLVLQPSIGDMVAVDPPTVSTLIR
jgi:hypothetical protein